MFGKKKGKDSHSSRKERSDRLADGFQTDGRSPGEETANPRPDMLSTTGHPLEGDRIDRSVYTDIIGSDAKAIELDAGMAGKILIGTLDKAMGWQTSIITGYVNKIRRKHPDESPMQIQKRIDAHFIRLVTSSGGAAGGAAVIPGVGIIMGMGAIAVESVAFLEAASWHVLASAVVRGIDIEEKERRRSLILLSLTGSSGAALVQAALGGNEVIASARQESSASMMRKVPLPKLGGINKQLLQIAQKRMMKSVKKASLGKLMPMGVGLVIGSTANRKMGRALVERVRGSLGPVPQTF